MYDVARGLVFGGTKGGHMQAWLPREQPKGRSKAEFNNKNESQNSDVDRHRLENCTVELRFRLCGTVYSFSERLALAGTDGLGGCMYLMCMRCDDGHTIMFVRVCAALWYEWGLLSVATGEILEGSLGRVRAFGLVPCMLGVRRFGDWTHLTLVRSSRGVVSEKMGSAASENEDGARRPDNSTNSTNSTKQMDSNDP